MPTETGDARREHSEISGILRINAACRAAGTNYSLFMGKLFKAKIALNRKMLSEIAIQHPEVFQAIMKEVK